MRADNLVLNGQVQQLLVLQPFLLLSLQGHIERIFSLGAVWAAEQVSQIIGIVGLDELIESFALSHSFFELL